MVRAVIFDFDDTLVKTYAVKWDHHKAVAKQFYRIELTDEEIKKHWGEPFDVLITNLYRNSDTIEKMRAANRSNHAQFLKELFEGSLNAVNELLDRSIQIGVLTATNKEFVLDDLSRLGFPFGKFFSVQAADETSVHKPDPRVFEPTLKRLKTLGIGSEDVVYVGDALSDFYAARDAGLDFIAITTGITSVQEFQKQGVSKIIADIGELSSLISSDTPYPPTL